MKCADCDDTKGVVDDPRDPPNGETLCSDCGEAAIVECIEDTEERLNDLVKALRKLNPLSYNLIGRENYGKE